MNLDFLLMGNVRNHWLLVDLWNSRHISLLRFVYTLSHHFCLLSLEFRFLVFLLQRLNMTFNYLFVFYQFLHAVSLPDLFNFCKQVLLHIKKGNCIEIIAFQLCGIKFVAMDLRHNLRWIWFVSILIAGPSLIIKIICLVPWRSLYMLWR